MMQEVNWANSYKSPISIESVCDGILEKSNNDILRYVYDIVFKYGVVVDKEQLIKALLYDRNQFKEGYMKGCADARADIVRCKDCKHYSKLKEDSQFIGWCYERQTYGWEQDDYCNKGESMRCDEEI